MAQTAKRQAIYEDILRLPEHLVGEILHGQLHTHPRPAPKNALAHSTLFELAPDWVCEILSPSTAQVDRTVKMPIYARENITYLWLVDPDLKTLEV